MMEHFKAREEGNPTKLIYVANLSEDFVDELKTGSEDARQKMIEIFASELKDWIEQT